jgi:hypothetical protein
MRLNLLAGARMLSLAAFLAIAAISASGCGTNDAQQALDPAAQAEVVKAADVTGKQSRGTAMTITGTIKTDGQSVSMKGEGVADKKSRGTFTLTVAGPDKTVEVDEVLDPPLIYMRSDVLKKELPDGKSWLKLDYAAAAKKQGLDINAFSPSGTPQSPDQALDYLKSAGATKDLGSEVVNGRTTTHYHVDADLKKMAKLSSSPNASKTADKLIELLGSDTMPVDVWIDSRHHVRREKLHYTVTAAGQSVTTDMTIELTRFGVPVRVNTPADDDTVDALKLGKNADDQ